MALINNPNLYTGGAVAFDNSQTVNLYAQLKARQEAKRVAAEEAFGNYLKEASTKVNAAGKRSQDDPAFQHLYNDWQKFAIENKDKLLKNDIQAQSELTRRYQRISNLVNESKKAEEEKKPIIELMIDPSKRSQLDETSLFPQIQSHDQPLYVIDEKTGEVLPNPKRKPIDLASINFEPKFDIAEGFGKWSKGMEKGKKIGEIVRNDPKTGQVIRSFEKSFSPEQTIQIATNAARNVAEDKNARAYYAKRFKNIGEDEYNKLNAAFQSVYGKEIDLGVGGKAANFIDSPEELAAADAILQARSMTEKGQEDEINYSQRLNDRRINISLSQGGGSKPTTQINLTEYPDEPGGGKNVTDIFQGVTVTDIAGKKLPAKKVVYNPATQRFIVTEWQGVDNDGNPTGQGRTRELGFDTFIQNIKNSNPQTDIKFIETLRTASNSPRNGPSGGGAVGGGMVTVVLKDGRRGQIPANQVDKFLKDNPGSKRQ